ncbi:MAG: hypothetical protein JWN43_110 [Gammaproteobacteria bacterium]|nr:hypothetical protein [Gammaproteobacteria bacterium]
MKSVFIAAIAAVCVSFAGCATPGTATSTTAAAPLTTQQKLTNLAMSVNKQCTVALPFLATMKQVQTDPNALKITTDLDDTAVKLCGVTAAYVAAPIVGVTAPAFSLADVQTFVNSNVPQLIALVQSSTKLTAAQKTAAELGITGAQTILAIAVANAQ